MSNENVNCETQISKEKRGWFHSLTRRNKSQSQQSLASPQTSIQCNNNNADFTEHSNSHSNFFKRIRKKISLSSLRRKSRDDEIDEKNGTTDASEEFLTNTKPTLRLEQELKFEFEPKGRILKNLPNEEDEIIPFSADFRRFVAQKWKGNGNENFRASLEMLNQVWYWGEISRRDAQKQLTDKPTGSFLVRDSETSGFTLSFRIINVTLHYRLEYRENYWRFEELQYESIVEMIEDILFRCTNDNFLCFVKVPNEMQPPFPVILKYPLSRYSKMPTLQDLCRRAIQRNSTAEEISKLPLPPKLQDYLSEKRGLVFAY